MEHKLRGVKHRQNNKRFQNKAKVVHNPQESFKVPHVAQKLESNWNRYDELPEDNETEQTKSNDFGLLAQAPTSHGGHFQFKSDKNLESQYDFDCLKKNNIFSLDLNLLVNSLNTIPFHERCGLDMSYLTEEELNASNRNVQLYKMQYEELLKNKQTEKTCDKPDKPHVNEISSDIKKIQAGKLVIQGNIAHSSGDRQSKSNAEGSKVDQEDLEEWLDDILDS